MFKKMFSGTVLTLLLFSILAFTYVPLGSSHETNFYKLVTVKVFLVKGANHTGKLTSSYIDSLIGDSGRILDGGYSHPGTERKDSHIIFVWNRKTTEVDDPWFPPEGPGQLGDICCDWKLRSSNPGDCWWEGYHGPKDLTINSDRWLHGTATIRFPNGTLYNVPDCTKIRVPSQTKITIPNCNWLYNEDAHLVNRIKRNPNCAKGLNIIFIRDFVECDGSSANINGVTYFKACQGLGTIILRQCVTAETLAHELLHAVGGLRHGSRQPAGRDINCDGNYDPQVDTGWDADGDGDITKSDKEYLLWGQQHGTMQECGRTGTKITATQHQKLYEGANRIPCTTVKPYKTMLAPIKTYPSGAVSLPFSPSRPVVYSFSDQTNDLIYFSTGQYVPPEDYVAYLDVVVVEAIKRNYWLEFHVTVNGGIPPLTQTTFWNILMDVNNDPADNCLDYPTADVDTMYSVIYNAATGEWKIERAVWKVISDHVGWWMVQNTGANWGIISAWPGGLPKFIISIPLTELSELGGVLPWKVMTETFNGASKGDLTPDEGLAYFQHVTFEFNYLDILGSAARIYFDPDVHEISLSLIAGNRIPWGSESLAVKYGFMLNIDSNNNTGTPVPEFPGADYAVILDIKAGQATAVLWQSDPELLWKPVANVTWLSTEFLKETEVTKGDSFEEYLGEVLCIDVPLEYLNINYETSMLIMAFSIDLVAGVMRIAPQMLLPLKVDYPPCLYVNVISAEPNMNITVYGTGFTPNAKALILFDGVEVGAVICNDAGNFTAVITVPSTAYGKNHIQAIDGEGKTDIVLVEVFLMGDINQDTIVDIFDIVIVGIAFGSTPVDVNWDPRADVNNDGLVDIFDIVLVAVNFGRQH